MLQGEITFDRVVRWVLTALGFFVVYTLLDVLSGVLWQFFLAWVLAYFTYPLVVFLERRCRIRWRVVSILVAMLLVLSLVALFVVLTVPPMVREVSRLTDDVLLFVQRWIGENNVYEQIQALVQNEEMQRKMLKVLEHDGTLDAFRYIALQAWDFLSQTAQILIGVVNVFVVFLYFFFILLDYETFSEGWQRLIPKDNRPAVVQLLKEVEDSMNRYFRGQGLIALLVGIGFAIGFSIVGLPMAVGVGLFIGLLNMVPYLQMLGIFPVTVLALLKASDSGESFWVIIGLCAIVFAVVQSLQDLVLTPKIMGKAMGMNPAVILLSLSVWGCLLGFIGLVIALPLTMLCFTYYKRFVAQMVELVDTRDLKSLDHCGRTGSSPVPGTFSFRHFFY